STPTITLRPFKLSDADDFLSWAGNDNVTRYCRWNSFTSKEQAVGFLKSVIKSHPWYRAICVDGDDDRPVGSIFVMPGEAGKDERKGEVGYALAESYWGKGIATVAVKKATSIAMKELDLDRVEGLVFVENKGSQKVLEKAGFRREGILSKYFFVKGKSIDIVVYSVVV
ncbi:Uncharacterized N-acetyltransferase YoaA, partial [Linum grandiflorum]